MSSPQQPGQPDPSESANPGPPPGQDPPRYGQPPPDGQPPPQFGAPQYGAPQYGAPQFGAPQQSQWGQAPQYGQPQYGGYYPAPTSTNGFAIASLICAFFCAPLGIIFGFIAKSQISRTGQQGNGLATAGIVVSIASIVLGIVLFATGVAVLHSGTN